MTTRPAPLGRDAGAIFVEAMIAAAIVALALAGTLKVIADSARRGQAVELRREALLVARSRLDAVGADIPLRAGDSAGAAGDLVWSVRVTAAPESVADSAAGGLWRVAVSVRPRQGGPALASLATLRLGPAAG